MSIHPLSIYSTDIYWRVNNDEKRRTFLKNPNLNREDSVNTHAFYKRKTEMIIVWIGVSVRDGWSCMAREGLKVTEALKFKPERFEHMEIGR